MVYNYYLIIAHATEPSVLLAPEDDLWTIPMIRSRQRVFWQEVGHINQAVWELYGLRVTTLRCLRTAYDPAQDRVTSLYALENQI